MKKIVLAGLAIAMAATAFTGCQKKIVYNKVRNLG